MAAKEIINTSLFSEVYFYPRFEDNWNDSSADNYHLTASGSPTFVTGKFGKAANFVATSSQYAYRDASAMSGVIISTSQTWSFWINIATFIANNYIMGRSTGGNWFMFGGDDGSISWSSGLSVSHSVTLPTTGTWHHVCFSYDSSANKIYSWLNGVIVQNGVSVTGSVSGAGTNFAIGRIGDFAGYGTFAIDDLGMFPRVFTQTDINKILPSTGVKTNWFF